MLRRRRTIAAHGRGVGGRLRLHGWLLRRKMVDGRQVNWRRSLRRVLLLGRRVWLHPAAAHAGQLHSRSRTTVKSHTLSQLDLSSTFVRFGLNVTLAASSSVLRCLVSRL